MMVNGGDKPGEWRIWKKNCEIWGRRLREKEEVRRPVFDVEV